MAVRRALRLAVLRSPFGAALAVAAALFSVWFVVWPLFAARYPPMTDLPFHAAQTSIFAHYADPSYHFREQFELHPFAVPYMSSYAIGALLMHVVSVATAVKIASAVMLLLLPAGLAVLFAGMKKTPLLGVLGSAFVWGALTHWGFLNYVGAIGLFVMIVGETLLVVDRPTPARRLALCLTLVALFFTHVFRFPFAICGVLGAAISVAPATRRVKPVLLPMLPSLLLFAVWWFVRPLEVSSAINLSGVHGERMHEVPRLLVSGFIGPEESALFGEALRAGIVVALLAIGIAAVSRWRWRPRRTWLFDSGATFAVASCALVFLGMFLVLPMEIGLWWYVYPREITAASFVALGLFPDLPKSTLLRAALLAMVAFSLVPIARLVEKNYAAFDVATADFSRIEAEIPKAPKLLYLIFDRGGTARTMSPFLHLPAYVQAEHGGFLSFHFAMWGASPVAYRRREQRGAVVPPAVPLRWEWTPQIFDVKRHGAFFDWFLVRDARDPERLFRADPSIVKVDHQGTWWLYRRK